MNSYIFLDNVRFFAYHGVGQQEREVGNEFVINLKLKVDIARAAETDDVTHTISYADVYENVKAEMEIIDGACLRTYHKEPVPQKNNR